MVIPYSGTEVNQHLSRMYFRPSKCFSAKGMVTAKKKKAKKKHYIASVLSCPQADYHFRIGDSVNQNVCCKYILNALREMKMMILVA